MLRSSIRPIERFTTVVLGIRFSGNILIHLNHYGIRAHLRDEVAFEDAARSSTTDCNLDAVSFVKPIGEENEHPGYASTPKGNDKLTHVLQFIEGGNCRKDTLVIVTYDEFGGQWDHVPPPGQGTTFNLSRGGCALETDMFVAVDDPVSLLITVSNQPTPIVIELGKVRWSTRREFGVEFMVVENVSKRRLDDFLLVVAKNKVSS